MANDLLPVVVSAVLGGGLVAAIFNGIRDWRTSRVTEKKTPVEIKGLELTNAEQALVIMEKLNDRLDRRVKELEQEVKILRKDLRDRDRKLEQKSDQIEELEGLLARIRRDVDGLVGKCDHLEGIIITLQGKWRDEQDDATRG